MTNTAPLADVIISLRSILREFPNSHSFTIHRTQMESFLLVAEKAERHEKENSELLRLAAKLYTSVAKPNSAAWLIAHEMVHIGCGGGQALAPEQTDKEGCKNAAEKRKKKGRGKRVAPRKQITAPTTWDGFQAKTPYKHGRFTLGDALE